MKAGHSDTVITLSQAGVTKEDIREKSMSTAPLPEDTGGTTRIGTLMNGGTEGTGTRGKIPVGGGTGMLYMLETMADPPPRGLLLCPGIVIESERGGNGTVLGRGGLLGRRGVLGKETLWCGMTWSETGREAMVGGSAVKMVREVWVCQIGGGGARAWLMAELILHHSQMDSRLVVQELRFMVQWYSRR